MRQPILSALAVALAVVAIADLDNGSVAMAAGNNPPACTAEPYRAFDFWLGEWDVYAQGKLAGHNKIEAILDGCALSESWNGATGGRGHSYNAFDAQSGSWNQFWVDSNGLVLRLVGEAKDGSMSMLGLIPISGEEKVVMRHRITWTPQAGGQVRQEWTSARSDSEDWQVVFDGLYVPAGSPAPVMSEPAS